MSKSVTLRNMASVTIKRGPRGAVLVTGRKMAGVQTNAGKRFISSYALRPSSKLLALQRQLKKANEKYDKAWKERKKYSFDDFMENVPGTKAAERAYKNALRDTERIRERVEARQRDEAIASIY